MDLGRVVPRIASVSAVLLILTLTPAPSLRANTIPPTRLVPLTARDLVYDSSRDLLYAAVLSGPQAGVAVIDPVPGSVSNTVLMAGGAAQLAISDNDQYLYVATGSSISRIDLASQVIDKSFSASPLGYGVEDISVRPGHSDTIAVSLAGSGSPRHRTVVMFKDSVQLPNSEPSMLGGSNLLDFGDANTLYGYNNEGYDTLITMSVDDSGLTVTNDVHSFVGNASFKAKPGLVYSSTGSVADPATGDILGTFDPLGYVDALEVDTTNQRAYMLRRGSSGIDNLDIYDSQSFVLLASMSTRVPFAPALVRWGSNGLAYVDSSNVVLLESDDFVSPVPPPEMPTSYTLPDGFLFDGLRTAGSAYSPVTDRLYASIAGNELSLGNRVLEINPHTGVVESSIPVGSDPETLAISSDGVTLFVALNGASAFDTVDLTTRSVSQRVRLGAGDGGPRIAEDIAALPQVSGAAVVSLRTRFNGHHEGVARYDNGVKAPNQTANHPISNVIEAAAVNLVYGLDQETTGSSLQTMSIDTDGVTLTSSVGGFFNIGNVEFSYADGLIYTTAGYVIDPSNATVVGNLQGCGASVVAESSLAKVFCGADGQISVYSMSDLSLIGVIDRDSAELFSLTRWGASGLAYGSGTGAFTIMDFDADADGVSAEVDNCPLWWNPPQNTPPWLVPAGDDDCDGFTNTTEYLVGADSSVHCATTPARNDEPLPDAWPVDFNDDQKATILDVSTFSPIFGSMSPGPPYNVRHDFNADGRITILDVAQYSAFFGKGCSP